MDKRSYKSGAEKRSKRKRDSDRQHELISKVPKLSTFFTIASDATETQPSTCMDVAEAVELNTDDVVAHDQVITANSVDGEFLFFLNLMMA
jgi:hypothetical protein